MIHKLLAGKGKMKRGLSLLLCLALLGCSVISSNVTAEAESEVTTTATEELSEDQATGQSGSAEETASETVTESITEVIAEASTEETIDGLTESISETTTEAGSASEEEISAEAESSTLSLESSVSATADDGISLTAISGDTEVAVDDTITLTGSSGSNHNWTVTSVTGSATITYSGATAYVTGVSEGTVQVTHTYRTQGSSRNQTENYTVTVTAGSSTIKVYVYVSASGMSDEMLELLGIDPDTLDGNGFFPAGEITLDRSYLNGKDTSTGAALINSASDWATVLAALSNMDTSTLTGEYAANQGNNVPDYLDQAEQDINGYIGSGYSALFRWNMTTSYGFEDQTVQYHLDLRFSTKTITFITGNNGITSETATDGTTVDSRTYITGSIIQEPRNLNIPDGYKFAGYYTDAAMTEEWDGIGTALNEDTVVYIKLVPLTDVTINYVVQVGKGTVTDPSSSGVASQTGMEHFNPVTGASSIEGSTATASDGYEFDGWYSNEACTVLVSESEHYTPSTPSGGWNEGDEYTYYAKFVPTKTSVTVTKVWDDNGSSLRPDNISIKLYADDATTATVEATITGSGDTWTYIFEDLPEYNYSEDGTATTKIVYTAEEESVSGYTSKVVTNENGSITVTNTLSTATLTLEKEIDSNAIEDTKEFQLTVIYTNKDGTEVTEIYNFADGGNNESNPLVVQLGSMVTITEVNGNCEVSATVNGKDATITGGNTISFTITTDTSVVVTNTYYVYPDTGVNLDSVPYIALLCGVVALGAVVLIRRRRRLL